jgi:tripartite-type tricarboxylate transporter receptor subunit TctC
MRTIRAATAMAAAAGSLIAVLQSPALSQAPVADTRPVTLVVPIAAGGGVDTIARVFAALLGDGSSSHGWWRTGGASGLVGLDSVAKATPDGHTPATFETSAALQQWLRRTVPFDVVENFAPVAQMSTTPLVLFAGPASPVFDLKGLIAYAKANPGKLSAATPGMGTPRALALQMLNATAAQISLSRPPSAPRSGFSLDELICSEETLAVAIDGLL